MKKNYFIKNIEMSCSFYILLLFLGSCSNSPNNNENVNAPTESTKIICLGETTLPADGEGTDPNNDCTKAYDNAITNFMDNGRKEAERWCKKKSCTGSTCVMVEPEGYIVDEKTPLPNQYNGGCLYKIKGKIVFKCNCK